MEYEYVISNLLQQMVEQFQDRASAAGLLAQFDQAYRSLMRRATTNPHDGDFVYWLPTGRPVYVIANAPLVMYYAVYEAEKVVWVTRVTLLGSEE